MKFTATISKPRHITGILLMECLVYLAVFTILAGIGLAAFYFCWDHTKSVIYATDDIAAALRAGECWRTDMRGATGKISVKTTPAGEAVRLSEPGKVIVYRFESGEVRRELSTLKNPQLLLPKVKTSQMTTEMRGGITAWRWELELAERGSETRLPLRFTFETVQTQP
jgi:uncharacterized protein YndB with AHSA1/START domain